MDSSEAKGVIEHKSYARVGFLGNPSDVYFGKTISFSLGNFWASVKLEPSDHLVIKPHPTHDLVQFNSLDHLVHTLSLSLSLSNASKFWFFMFNALFACLCSSDLIISSSLSCFSLDANVVDNDDKYDYDVTRYLINACINSIFSAVVMVNNLHVALGTGFMAYMNVNRLQSEGYYGGVRLLMAICKVFYKHCKDNEINLQPGNFTLSYDTNIPRQTGLSGSSAIVCAALNCLLDFYNVRHLIKVEVRPNIILGAEKELGIVAGLQDRVAQVYGGLVHMVHSTVRQRWLDGDEFIMSSMEEVANIAAEGQSVILEKNYQRLAELMNCNFDLRRRMFGDECLGALNIEMVEVARRVGAASKFTGSGGAVVAFCPDGPSQVKLLEDACHKAGFIIQPIQLVPSFLNDVDLKTLSKLN
ncbi:hypothetical protein CCACVL1_24922 [Corchorus capsularis]|uniref:GHMP kinase N-terminal domain-containing protein n=1 Tax=Corchorus capsularis TaxID=210143 RepID=A0A1R3GMI3_COCAP|nr:hypothetical protein CCACVL1_24922 [Corchorus capsularis]